MLILLSLALGGAWVGRGQQYSFEIFQFPGASITTPTAINNHGQIVGIVQGLGTNMGFFKDGSVYSLISAPGAGPLNGTVAHGINDNAQVVGSYTTETTDVLSHGWEQTGSTITTFDVPGGTDTEANGINNFGQIVGRFFTAPTLQLGRGFIKDGTNFTYFDVAGVQGPAGTMPYGINDSGQIVGEFLDSIGFHSFLFQSNQFSVINVPQSGDTHVYGINNSGQLAGSYSAPMGGTHGFITIGDRFFQIDVPGVQTTTGTSVWGINDSGQVVGSVSVDGSTGVFDLGFVGTPCSGAGTNCINLPEIPQPDLRPVALQAPATVTATPNPTINVIWGVANQGGDVLGSSGWVDRLYLSTNTSLNGASIVMPVFEHGPIAAGGSYWRTNAVYLPVTQSGAYYLILKTDSDNSLFESNANNNSIAVPITLKITPPDLAAFGLQVPTNIIGPPYVPVTVAWGGTNQGSGPALNQWFDLLYVSSNSVFDLTASQLAQNYHYGPMAPGTAYNQTNTFRLPLVNSGSYYFFFWVDAYQYVLESDESNNVLTVPFTFDSRPPDLAPVALQTPGSLTAPPYPTIPVVWAVTNQGAGDALGNPYWTDTIYLSTNSDGSGAALVSSGYEFGPLSAGSVYWRTNTFTLPVVQSGTYYLVFRTDIDNSLAESTTNNNGLVFPISITITPADLVPLALQVPSVINGPPRPEVTLIYGTTNQGSGAARSMAYDSSWYDGVFVSTNGFLDSSSLFVEWDTIPGPLAPGAAFLQTNTVRLPIIESGDYFLIFQSDGQNMVYESNENNNIIAVPFTFNPQPPDLTPVALVAPAALTALPHPAINVAWGVLNQGLGEALAKFYPDYTWSDQLFLSTSNSPDGGTLVGSYDETGPVAPGGTYWRTNSVLLPVTQSGVYYLVFKADVNNSVFESDTANNTLIVPITLTITPPDLTPIAFQAPSAVTAPPYPTITLAWGVTNQGTGSAIGTPWWADQLFISSNSVLDYTAKSVSFFYESGPIAPGTAYWRTNSLTVPIVSSGTYYLFFVADANDSLQDANRSNNVAVAQVTFNIQPADLTPLAFVVPSVVSGPPNPKLLFSWMVTNIGSGAALPQWSDQLYFSTQSNLDWTASLVTTYEGDPVPPGSSYQRSHSATVPVTQSGQYYFVFQTDVGNSLYESNTTNNMVSAQVTFQIDPPDLSPIVLQAPAAVAGSLNPTITLTYAVTNQGTGAAVSSGYSYNWQDQLFVSTNSVLDGSEIPVGDYNGWTESGPVAAGSAYWRTRTVQLPLMASGKYYLLLRVNASGTLFESNLTNNVLAVPITVNLQLPDLAPLALVAASLIASPPYPSLTLVWGITNQGLGQALGSSTWPYGWFDTIYLSSDTNVDWPGAVLSSTVENGPIAPGASYWQTNVVTLPVTNSGTSYLVLRTDDSGYLPEINENNNVLVVPITVQVTGLPDLVPLAMQGPPALTNYSLVTVVTSVTNEGSGTAQASPRAWQDAILISTNPVVDSTASFVTAAYESGPVPPGATYSATNVFYLPQLQDGNYFFILQVNGNQALAESNSGNNTLAVPFSFHLVPPDLAPIAFQAPAVVDDSAFPIITVIWGVTNQGPGLAWGFWSDALYVSTNTDTTGAIAYGLISPENSSVAAGSTYWQTNTVQLQVTTSGNYYLVFKTDFGNSLQETNLANNVAALPLSIHILEPDLAPVMAQVPAEITGAANPLVDIVWAVTNGGAGTANGAAFGWSDTLYISTNSVLDGSAIWVWYEYETNSLPAGGLYWHSNTVALPVSQSGTYYLFLVANENEWLAESDYSNNVLVRTVEVTIQPPDLAPVALVVPNTVTGAPWPTVTVVVGVTNGGIGTVSARPGWQDGLYLSAYPFLDDSSFPFLTWSRTNAVLPGSVYWTTNIVRLPVVDSGTLYLIFKTDIYGQVTESDESNNSTTAAITFELSPTPNLVPLELIAPPALTGPPDPTVTLAWRVANQGPGPTAGQWVDNIYLSSSPNVNWGVRPLLSAVITNVLVPGAEYWHTNSFTLHGVYQGPYFFVLSANSDGGLFETDTSDNLLSVPVQVDLAVAPAGPIIAGAAFLPNGALQLAVYADLGSQWTLQASTNLMNWVAISNFTIVAVPTYVADPQAASFQQRFYRLAKMITPLLSISRTATNSVVLSWPLPADGWVLEQTSSLVGPLQSWTQLPTAYQTNSAQAWITLTNSADISFYRLHLP